MTSGPAAVLVEAPAAGVALLRMNRGARRNALSAEMMSALQEELAATAADPAVRVVILAADGPAFCAGHDLKEMTAHRAAADGGRGFYAELFRQCSDLMLAIVRHPRPVIAMVQGIATAAGCQIVASCDLAVAAEGASFATPGVNIGLFCSTPMVALSRNVSRKHAMEMLLTGDAVGAVRARELGLVNRVVAADRLLPETLALAAQIAGKPWATLKLGKAAFYAQAEMKLDDAYAYAAEVMTQNMMAREAVEGICAFVEKREPKWPSDGEGKP
ncbi:MAG: enoyl-CoA hydratase [Alphaproteobacteria bacterium]|nr:enoyl-CoA hydratase [Alphaproteobacteria bacterium]